MPDDLRATSFGEADLVAALADVGDRLAYPAERAPGFDRALVAAIERSMHGEPPSRGVRILRLLRDARLRSGSWSTARRAFVLAVTVVVLLAATAAAATFAIRGVQFIFGPAPTGLPTVPPTSARTGAPTGPETHGAAPPLGSDLFLGEHMTLAEARSRLGFGIEVPTLPGLARPEVYVAQVVPGGALNLVYPPAGAASGPGRQGVWALITEFVGRVDRPFMQKFVGRGTSVRPMEVGRFPGLWVSGEPHEVAYVASDGSLITDSLRLSANALLWQHGDLTLRVETAMPLDRALPIARSMR